MKNRTHSTWYNSQTNTYVDVITGEVKEIEVKKRFRIRVDTEPFYMVFLAGVEAIGAVGKNGTTKSVLAWMCLNVGVNDYRVDMPTAARKEICRMFNISNTTLSNCLNELKMLNIITGEQGRFNINPALFWRGDLRERQKLLQAKEIQLEFSIDIDTTNQQLVEEKNSDFRPLDDVTNDFINGIHNK